MHFSVNMNVKVSHSQLELCNQMEYIYFILDLIDGIFYYSPKTLIQICLLQVSRSSDQVPCTFSFFPVLLSLFSFVIS